MPSEPATEVVKSQLVHQIDSIDYEEVSEDSNLDDVMESNALTSEVTHGYFNDEEESEEVPRSHFSRTHWA